MIDYRERAPDNATPYQQGRSDQRWLDWPVAIACLIALAIYLVFTERT